MKENFYLFWFYDMVIVQILVNEIFWGDSPSAIIEEGHPEKMTPHDFLLTPLLIFKLFHVIKIRSFAKIWTEKYSILAEGQAV